MDTKAIEKVDNIMPKKVDTISTSIRVPEDKYIVLEEIKILENRPINALVVEGIDLVITKYRNELKQNRDRRADIVNKVLDEIKE